MNFPVVYGPNVNGRLPRPSLPGHRGETPGMPIDDGQEHALTPATCFVPVGGFERVVEPVMPRPVTAQVTVEAEAPDDKSPVVCELGKAKPITTSGLISKIPGAKPSGNTHAITARPNTGPSRARRPAEQAK